MEQLIQAINQLKAYFEKTANYTTQDAHEFVKNITQLANQLGFDTSEFLYAGVTIDDCNQLLTIVTSALESVSSSDLKVSENKILFAKSFYILMFMQIRLQTLLQLIENPVLSNSAESIDGAEGGIEGTLSNNGAPSPFTPNKIDYNQLDLPADKYPIYLEFSTLTQNCLNHLSKLNIFTFSALWSFSQDNQYQFFYTDYKKHYPRVLDEIEMILYDMANCHWPRVYKNWV